MIVLLILWLLIIHKLLWKTITQDRFRSPATDVRNRGEWCSAGDIPLSDIMSRRQSSDPRFILVTLTFEPNFKNQSSARNDMKQQDSVVMINVLQKIRFCDQMSLYHCPDPMFRRPIECHAVRLGRPAVRWLKCPTVRQCPAARHLYIYENAFG